MAAKEVKKATDKVIQRIQRLLAMAADVSSPNEAAIAARRAEVLMREHQLSQVDVLVKNLDGDSVEVSTVNHMFTLYGLRYKNYRSTRIPGWVGITGVSAAVMNECEADNLGGLTRFYGVEGDAQVAAEIFRYLIDTINRLATQFPGTRGERSAFRQGCAGTLQDRCKEIAEERKRQFQETSAGTSLIVLKQQLIEQCMGGKMEYGSHKSATVEDLAYAAGQIAGLGINLNKQISAQEKKRQITR